MSYYKITLKRFLDQVGLALYTRPEVQAARVRLYIHHMLQGWPNFEEENKIKFPRKEIPKSIGRQKIEAWNERFVGFNIHSEISDRDLETLVDTYKVKWVRIGAVSSSGRKESFEFQFLQNDEENESAEFEELIEKLTKKNLKVVVTLDPRVASVAR